MSMDTYGKEIEAAIEALRDCEHTGESHTLADALRALVQNKLAAKEASKDSAYVERDKLVCALSKVFPSWLGRHPDTDTAWENDWRWIVYVQLPTGQCSWHIHDSERGWFDHLSQRDEPWDGHTTEEKYARLGALSIAALKKAQGERAVADAARKLYECLTGSKQYKLLSNAAINALDKLNTALRAPQSPSPGESRAGGE